MEQLKFLNDRLKIAATIDRFTGPVEKPVKNSRPVPDRIGPDRPVTGTGSISGPCRSIVDDEFDPIPILVNESRETFVF